MTSPKFSFSSEGVPPQKYSSLWPSVLKQIKIRGRAHEHDDFFVSVDSYIFGPTVLNFWKAKAVQYDRSQQDCRIHPNDDYSLMQVQEGSAEIGQRGRTVSAKTGDCLLVNLGEPLFVHCPSVFNFKALRLPASILKITVPSPQDSTAFIFSKDSVWTKALAALLDTLTPDTIDRLSFVHMPLIENFCCLISHAIDPEKQLIRSNKAFMLNRLRQSLIQNFYKPDFSPAKLAKEQGISTRTLYSVFANAGISFSRELLSWRMKQACRLLDDPRFDAKTVAEIGHLVGFLHPSHFTTRFHKTQGITPSAYRLIRQGKAGKEPLKPKT